eukprot:TRINITY_DN54265_c0_g1_i1.p1 TRINITY_DN54265_c0_g1~~TRINITY_DN54265_c0_g1_i1.p1  ORF type:complete len:356 (-),score=27.17 TRINITY_DN54265_c0_g1_i1:56-1123(-)
MRLHMLQVYLPALGAFCGLGGILLAMSLRGTCVNSKLDTAGWHYTWACRKAPKFYDLDVSVFSVIAPPSGVEGFVLRFPANAKPFPVNYHPGHLQILHTDDDVVDIIGLREDRPIDTTSDAFLVNVVLECEQMTGKMSRKTSWFYSGEPVESFKDMFHYDRPLKHCTVEMEFALDMQYPYLQGMVFLFACSVPAVLFLVATVIRVQPWWARKVQCRSIALVLSAFVAAIGMTGTGYFPITSPYHGFFAVSLGFPALIDTQLVHSYLVLTEPRFSPETASPVWVRTSLLTCNVVLLVCFVLWVYLIASIWEWIAVTSCFVYMALFSLTLRKQWEFERYELERDSLSSNIELPETRA